MGETAMKKRMVLLALLFSLAALFLPAVSSLASSGALGVSLEGVVRPGAPSLVTVTAAEAGEVDLVLRDESGQRVSVVALGRMMRAGENRLYWNGTWQGLPAPEGVWRLTVIRGEESAEAKVTVGPMAPCLIGAELSAETVLRGDSVSLRFFATRAGSLTARWEGKEAPLWTRPVQEGWGEAEILAETPGEGRLWLTLEDAEGMRSEPVALGLRVEQTIFDEWPSRPKATAFTPAWGSPAAGKDPTLNYWTLPMDITDTEAVWAVLTAPVTVVDNGRNNAERLQVILRREPREDSPGVGVVTCITQSVHVLERGKDWSLVECYSSSFHDSAVKNWNALVQGWLPTAYLKETLPDQTMGLVVDKLTQRLYIFRDGELYDTLQVSTGLANERQPYNETRSGEFLVHNWVGAIVSDDVTGRLAMRFNDGDLLHEVPYSLMSDGVTRDFSATDRKLGTRASHGCIRVQRKQTPKGTNHEWLWNHRKRDMKLLIWEDWQGRQLPFPDPELPLYVTSGRNPVYHTSTKCSQLKGARTTPVRYGALEEEAYAAARRCAACDAPLRRAEIEKTNQQYAPGGDHDPVMTAAREKAQKVLEETDRP